MLRTNLATRPFYNVRAVQAALGLLAVVVLAVTAYNAVRIVQLSALERELGTGATSAEAEAARLQADAARVRARIDEEAVEALAAAVAEANAIIDRRTFSWIALLTHVEETLPRDMRVTRIQRAEARGRGFLVTIDFDAYDVATPSRFMEALEATGAFSGVRPRDYTPDEGLIRGSVEAVYRPARSDPASDNGSAPVAGALAPAVPEGGPRE